MDASRVFTVLCGFLLVICLVLSVTTAIILRQAVAENEAWRSHAEAPVLTPEVASTECVTCLGTAAPTEKEDAPSVDADILYHRLCMREVGGKIGIYSEDGYLIRTLNVAVKALPKKDQDALSKGIYVNSWEELIALIEDYE